MRLYKSPYSYSSASGNDLFRFDSIDPTKPVEVAFHTADGTLLGTRRYYGRTSVDVSPRAFLRTLLSPTPVVVDSTLFLRPAGRDAAIYLRYGLQQLHSPVVGFTSSRYHHDSPAPLVAHAEPRRLAEGECDEVAILVESGVMLQARGRIGAGEWSELARMGTSESGVHILAVAYADLLTLTDQPHSEQRVEVEILADGEVLCGVDYILAESEPQGVRVAWVDSEGAIAYHTFGHLPECELLSSRVVVEADGGVESLAVESWRRWRVESGRLSAAEWERLSEALGSPRLWVVERGGGVVEVVAEESRAVATGPLSHTLSLTLREARKQQHL